MRLRFRQLSDPPLRDQPEDLRREMALRDDTAEARLAELEDRVDFAERRLTQGVQPAQPVVDRIPTPA